MDTKRNGEKKRHRILISTVLFPQNGFDNFFLFTYGALTVANFHPFFSQKSTGYVFFALT